MDEFASGFVNIACFHIPSPDPKKAAFYWDMYELMISSAKKVMPFSKAVLITNDAAVVPQDLSCDAILRLPSIDDIWNNIMLYEIQGWREYIYSDLFNAPTILIDTDVLFQRNVTGLFKTGFDVGLTHETPSLKINAGVIFCNNINVENVRFFFDQLVRKIDEIKFRKALNFRASDGSHPPLSRCGGDEEALEGLFSKNVFFTRCPPTSLMLDQTRVRVFMGDPYNYVDHSNDFSVLQELKMASIIHFAGDRKHLMIPYASKYLGIEVRRNK